MSSQFRIIELTLTPLDYFFFVSREFNQQSSIDMLIHNYALHYAFADKFHVGGRGATPNYEELEEYPYYIYPAFPLGQPKSVFHTYNAIDSKTGKTQSIMNVPATGKYQKIIPSTTEFRTYLLASSIPKQQYIRIGKKLSIFRVKSHEIDEIKIIKQPAKPLKSSAFINVLDYIKKEFKSFEAIRYLSPTPVIQGAELFCPFIIFKDKIGKKQIPIPTKMRKCQWMKAN